MAAGSSVKGLQPIGGEPLMNYDKYRAGDLFAIVPRQNQVIYSIKKNDCKHMFHIVIVIDDFADNPERITPFKTC